MTESALLRMCNGVWCGSTNPFVRKTISRLRNCTVRVCRVRDGKVYSPTRRRNKNCNSTKSLTAAINSSDRGLPAIYSTTSTGTANSGQDAGSKSLYLLSSNEMGRSSSLVPWEDRRGSGWPAKVKVCPTARSATSTDPTRICFPLPYSPVRTLAAKRSNNWICCSRRSFGMKVGTLARTQCSSQLLQ